MPSPATEVLTSSWATISSLKSAKRAHGRAGDAESLPPEFQVVARHLQVGCDALEAAQEQIEQRKDDSACAMMKPSVNECEKKAARLQELFLETVPLAAAQRMERYREDIRKLGKESRVEILMKEIMEGVRGLLTVDNKMKAATQSQIAELKEAIDQLSKVESSVSDSDFDRPGTNSQHIASGGTGHQSNITGQNHNIHSGSGNQYHAQTMSFASESDCLSKLCPTDPNDDKELIEKGNGGLRKDPYRWILNDVSFRQWRDDKQSRLLWIKGDPGRGKTMLLCGVINELKSTADTNLSFFFCQATGTRNNATAVLRGLIYLLVKRQKSLISHVQNEDELKREKPLKNKNAWVVVSRIFTNILGDPGMRNTTYLFIDALDECKIDLEKLLGLIVQVSAYPCVKWIISSQNKRDIEHDLHIEFPTRLVLELKQQVFESYVEIYKTKNETLGSDDPETLEVACGVARMLERQGKREEALNWYKEIYKARNKTLGFSNLRTLEVACDMARMLERQGKREEALNWYKEIYKTRNKTLGFGNPRTLEVARDVARMLERQGKREEARDWYKEIDRTT